MQAMYQPCAASGPFRQIAWQYEEAAHEPVLTNPLSGPLCALRCFADCSCHPLATVEPDRPFFAEIALVRSLRENGLFSTFPQFAAARIGQFAGSAPFDLKHVLAFSTEVCDSVCVWVVCVLFRRANLIFFVRRRVANFAGSF